mgnify:CR=1 FL=1
MTDQQDIENRIDIDEAVGRLPDRLRCVVLLHSYGYSNNDIAETLGVHRHTVRERLEKAFSLLKNYT